MQKQIDKYCTAMRRSTHTFKEGQARRTAACTVGESVAGARGAHGRATGATGMSPVLSLEEVGIGISRHRIAASKKDRDLTDRESGLKQHRERKIFCEVAGRLAFQNAGCAHRSRRDGRRIAGRD